MSGVRRAGMVKKVSSLTCFSQESLNGRIPSSQQMFIENLVFAR